LTLEDDVAALLLRVQKARKLGLKQAINTGLRAGLKQMLTSPGSPKPFKTKGVDLGRCLLGSLDDIADALAAAEGENFR
jgi:hypothetical protein